jgi:hypothetical protein
LGKKTRAQLGVCVVAWKRVEEEEETYLAGAAGGEEGREELAHGHEEASARWKTGRSLSTHVTRLLIEFAY